MRRVLCTAFVVLLIAVFCNNIIADARRQNDWEDNKKAITIMVQSGDSIDGYWVKYAPSWMSREQYREEIKELNNMTSAMLYAGGTIQVYVEGGNTK